MKQLILMVALLTTGRAAELWVPKFKLAQNAIQVRTAFQNLTVCTGRITYQDDDGTELPTEENYLIQYINGYPIIADRIDGFSVSLEMRDINGDGRKELIALFHGGAHNYGVKVYDVTKSRYRPVIYPLADQPPASNMSSIKFVNGEIHVQVQTFLPDGKGAQIETMRYKLAGDRIKLVGSTKLIVP